MTAPTCDVSIDIATCPSCKRTITAKAVVRVKVEQPKPKPLEGVRALPAHMQQGANPVDIAVTATTTIVGLDIDHACGEARRTEEAR